MAFLRALLLCSTLVLLHNYSCGEESARAVVSGGHGWHHAPRLKQETVRLQGGSADEAGQTLPAAAGENSSPCSCGDSDCPHRTATLETQEAALLRERKETLEHYITRIEQGEPLGLEQLPREIVQDLSRAIVDGRMADVMTAMAPWWMLHPFGNVSSQDLPEKAVRSAAAGGSVEETRAELTHNGGQSTYYGWTPTTTAESGVSDRWGLLWAQDFEQLVISFPVPMGLAAAHVHVELLRAGRHLRVRVDTCLLLDDDLWRAVRCPGNEESFDNWCLVHIDGVRLLKITLDKRRPPRQRLVDDSGIAADGEIEAFRALWEQLLSADAEVQDGELVCKAHFEESAERCLPIDKIRIMYQRPANCPRVPDDIEALMPSPSSGNLEAVEQAGLAPLVFAYCAVYRHFNGHHLDDPVHATDLLLSVSGLESLALSDEAAWEARADPGAGSCYP